MTDRLPAGRQVAVKGNGAVFSQRRAFGRSASRIDANEKRHALIRAGKRFRQILTIPVFKGDQFPAVPEQRAQGVIGLPSRQVRDAVCQFLQVEGFVSRQQGRSVGHIIKGQRRAGSLQVQVPVKGVPQHGEKRQRSAQVHHIARNGTAMGQTGDGLGDHGLENRGGNILLRGSLVQQRLDVAFRKHATPAGDRIELFVVHGQGIHFILADLQQRRHLVNEGAGPAGAGAVHAEIRAAGQKEDLGIFSPQFDHDIRIRPECRDGGSCRKNLLGKGDPKLFTQADPGRARDAESVFSGKFFPQCQEDFPGFFGDPGKVAFVLGMTDMAGFIQHNSLDGGGTDVQSDSVHRPPF